MEASIDTRGRLDKATSPATEQHGTGPKSDDVLVTFVCSALLAQHLTAVLMNGGGIRLLAPIALYTVFVVLHFRSGFPKQDIHIRNLFIATYVCGQLIPSVVVQNIALAAELILFALLALVDVVIVGQARLAVLTKLLLNHAVVFYIRIISEPTPATMTSTSFGLLFVLGMVCPGALCMLLERSANIRMMLSKPIIRTYAIRDVLTALYLRQLLALEERFGLGNPGLEWETTPFTYAERLSRYEVRLLILARRELGRPPCFQLIRKRLTDLPDFIACSYAWGKPTADHVVGVLIDTSLQHIKVTASLYNLLYREQSFFSTKALWIDAICINQSDKIEKAAQVAIMRSIFARASQVHAVFDSSLQSTGLRAWLHFCDKETRLTLNDRFVCRFDGEAENMIAATDLHAFFRTEWLQRLWILQEAVVAKRLTIRYRTMEIDWDQFAVLLSSVVVDTPSLSIMTTEKMAQRGRAGDLALQLRRAALVQATRSDWREGSTILSLDLLMERTKLLQASEERDRVFALLGMSEVDYKIPLSYSLPLSEIYAETVFSILREEKNLNFLSCTSVQRPQCTRTDLPSWVMPWTTTYSEPVKPWLSNQQRADFQLQSQPQANHGIVASLKPIANTFTLKIEADVLDRVLGVVDCADIHEMKDGIQDKLQLLLRHLWDSMNSISIQQNFLKEDPSLLRSRFWETLVLGRFDAEDRLVCKNDHNDAFRIFDKYLSITLDRQSSAEDAVLYSGIEDPFASRLGPDHVRKQLELVSSEIISTLQGRGFGWSINKLIMLLPTETVVDDIIITPKRSALPFVVRRMNERKQNEKQVPLYRFLGPCFILGKTRTKLETGKTLEFALV